IPLVYFLVPERPAAIGLSRYGAPAGEVVPAARAAGSGFVSETFGILAAAGLLATMGVCDLFGTTFSGWLTDRFDPRKLLLVYYSFRGLSLLYLPYSGFSGWTLSLFAVLYGLDWIATVPPTLKLANEAFGDRSGPIVFG